jgi:hypothetical protein
MKEDVVKKYMKNLLCNHRPVCLVQGTGRFIRFLSVAKKEL